MPTESQTLDNGKLGTIKWTCVLDIADLPTKMSEIKVKAENSVLKVTGKSSFDMIENGFKFGFYDLFEITLSILCGSCAVYDPK